MNLQSCRIYIVDSTGICPPTTKIMSFLQCYLPIVSLAVSQVPAEVRCRYNATSPNEVSYYTYTELATRYEITVNHFFLLNSLLDPDCTSIEAGKQYCVAGSVLSTLIDGSCAIGSDVSCLGYSGGQCCNLGTWKCGNTRYVNL